MNDRFEHVGQVIRLLWTTFPPSSKNPLEWDDRTRQTSHLISEIETGHVIIYFAVDNAQSRPDYRARLVGSVAEGARRVLMALDQIEQSLTETKTATEP